LKSVDEFTEAKFTDLAKAKGIEKPTGDGGGSNYTDEGGIRTYETPNANAALSPKKINMEPETLLHCIDSCTQAGKEYKMTS